MRASEATTVAGNAGAARVERRRARGWSLRFGGHLLARRVGEREVLVLTLICALDMYTTLFWVLSGHATEANPLLARAFDLHPITFVLVKCVTSLPALLLAGRLARRHPRFTVWLLRTITAAYIGIYLTYVG